MYPRLSDLFRDLFGIDLPLPIYSFGAMVALGVLVAAWLTGKQLDRMYRQGRISGVKVPAEEGKKKRRGRMVEASPSVLMGTCTVLAVVGGFAGAKVFHILENLDEFMLAPGRLLFSSGGFTFYGGLIVAGLSIAYYVRSKGVSVARFADAVSPGLMIAYGIGRIGCHLAGDGDWGIVSSVADKPGWLPTWLWAETYPNNILYGQPLPEPVFPTPLYEFAMAAVLFGILWSLRDHPFKAGWLFSLYLLVNGIERFLIEQIRVNNTFEFIGLTVTQAEVIAVLIMLAGLVGLARTTKRIGDPEGTAGTSASPAAAS